MMQCWIFFTVLLTTTYADIWDSPVIETNSGPVRGQTMPLASGEIVHSFWAIPYAAPPTGTLRFARPEQPDSWDELFVADTLGAACPQSAGNMWGTHPGFNNIDEDCLNLNVFAPEIVEPEDPGSYPVMVWFYGGAYTSGSNIMYPGHFFAGHDVVVVVVNYRIGNLGWTTTGDDVAKGNWGLWDQNFALHWVKDNIANFGGDPMQVTIFGQSAGASSSGLHMVSPHSRGLFDGVIAMSGTDYSFWALNWPGQDPEEYTQQVAAKLDCPTEDNQEMIDCLRDVPWEHFWNVSFTCKEGHFCQGMAPIIDGEGGFLPEDPMDVREDDAYSHVPLMTGNTREDGSLYTAGLIPESLLGGFNRSEFERLLKENLLDIWNPQFTEDVQDQVFDAMNWYYSPWPHIDDEEANRQAFVYMITDASFAALADSQAKSQSKQRQDDVFVYINGYRSANSSIPEWMGVPHAGDLEHVFGSPLLEDNPDVRFDTKMWFDFGSYTDMDVDYTNFLQTLWANFAKHFNPTPEPITSPTGQEVTWLPFEGWNVQDQQLNLLLMDNVTTEVIQDYRQRDFACIVNYIGGITGRRVGPEDTPGWPDEDDWKTRHMRDREMRSHLAGKALKFGGKGRRLESDTMQKVLEQFQMDLIMEKLEEYDVDLYDL